MHRRCAPPQTRRRRSDARDARVGISASNVEARPTFFACGVNVGRSILAPLSFHAAAAAASIEICIYRASSYMRVCVRPVSPSYPLISRLRSVAFVLSRLCRVCRRACFSPSLFTHRRSSLFTPLPHMRSHRPLSLPQTQIHLTRPSTLPTNAESTEPEAEPSPSLASANQNWSSVTPAPRERVEDCPELAAVMAKSHMSAPDQRWCFRVSTPNSSSRRCTKSAYASMPEVR